MDTVITITDKEKQSPVNRQEAHIFQIIDEIIQLRSLAIREDERQYNSKADFIILLLKQSQYLNPAILNKKL